MLEICANFVNILSLSAHNSQTEMTWRQLDAGHFVIDSKNQTDYSASRTLKKNSLTEPLTATQSREQGFTILTA